MSENVKNIGMGIGAIVVIAAAYIFFVAGGEEDQSALVTIPGDETTALPSGDASSAETIALINQLQGLDLDSEFMNSSDFENLVDFSLELNQQPVGRDNPFAPVFYIFPQPLFVNTAEQFQIDISPTEDSQSATTTDSDVSASDNGTSSDSDAVDDVGTTSTSTAEEDASFLFGL